MTLIKLAQRSIRSLQVGAQGLGCLGMAEFYGTSEEAESIYVIHRALELGATLLDTADVYGHGASEELIGKAIRDRRESAVISTKFGVVRPGQGPGVAIRGDAAYVRASCDASLQRLGTDRIDLLTLTRVDHEVGIEETVGALGELVDAGKIREIGLSEANSSTLRRATAVAPIAALQTEWSLWSRDIEADIVPTCRELGVAIIPYAPLGRGFLSGRIRNRKLLRQGDVRLTIPRFEAANLAINFERVERLGALAASSGATAAQWALSWLHGQGTDVIPIPGTSKLSNLEENIDAAFIVQSDSDRSDIEDLFPVGVAAGRRWNEFSMSFIES